MKTTRPALAMFAVLGVTALATPSFADEAPAPLSPAQQKIFTGSQEDPPAQKLLGVSEKYEGRSYLAGDERNMQLLYPHIKNIGGGYMGVGSDQTYIFIGWAKPELAWSVDYDEAVHATHGIYRSFFLKAKTPAEFLNLWKSKNRKEALAAMKETLGSGTDFKKSRSIYNSSWRAKIYLRHRSVIKTFRATKTPSYLTDQGQYDYVRGMVKNGRVRVMSANLLDRKGLVGVGEASKQLGVPLRILYLSNAEQYWPYSKGNFKKNIYAQHFDEKSVIVRTLSTWSKNKDYTYMVQPAQQFVAWLKSGVWKVRSMTGWYKIKTPDTIRFVKFDRAPRKKKARKKGKKGGK